MVNALASEGDEGRDERRYAPGSSKYAEIRGFPNGATRHFMTSVLRRATQRTETS